MLIAGDIGGTKTDLAICSIESGPRVPLAQTEVHSADYPCLEAVVAEFLADVDIRKGRFKNLMERVPVHVITTRAALLGAAAYGLDTLNPQLGAMTS